VAECKGFQQPSLAHFSRNLGPVIKKYINHRPVILNRLVAGRRRKTWQSSPIRRCVQHSANCHIKLQRPQGNLSLSRQQDGLPAYCRRRVSGGPHFTAWYSPGHDFHTSLMRRNVQAQVNGVSLNRQTNTCTLLICYLFIKTYLKFLKALLHVSVIRPSSGIHKLRYVSTTDLC
jgi:hypothetical protein